MRSYKKCLDLQKQRFPFVSDEDCHFLIPDMTGFSLLLPAISLSYAGTVELKFTGRDTIIPNNRYIPGKWLS
ncbi:hypothetical protein [Gimesia maris]|uniref:hypothetical protein n=1 Tax=Gimesia maris TaxID=122 RepID=UPI0012B8337E|nr:hypothetical protein [Gimesia maris]